MNGETTYVIRRWGVIFLIVGTVMLFLGSSPVNGPTFFGTPLVIIGLGMISYKHRN